MLQELTFMLEPGTMLGAYEVHSAIGAGGMGQVYRAIDTRLGRTVALKVLNGDHSERFETEARAIAALNHPNICTLYDVGPGFLVMEFLSGAPVRGPLEPARAVEVAIEIASALEAAHAKGIVHRDLKPDNILLTASGVKLLDFGLALQQAPDPETTRTRSGVIMGTWAYMAPEQMQGLPADARTDIYAFGLVLFELLAGHRPSPGESLRDAVPRIPEPLASLVARAIEREPARRFSSATLLIEALRQSLSGTAEPSIAVLPFANLSADPENEYFSDGLAEEIITALTRLPGVKVTARTSAFAFKGKAGDIRQISQALGVAHVLEGSVRKSGNRVRITAQLVNAADGLQVWSDRFDREMTDIFAVQDEISASVVGALKIRLGGAHASTMPRSRVSNVDAYNAYLEGQHHGNQRTATGFTRARECFERAMRLAPGYALPHAGMAELLSQIAFFRVRPSTVLPQALAAAERAIELDPSTAEAYAARGLIRGAFYRQWSSAQADFNRVLDLNPSLGLGYYRRSIWSMLQLHNYRQAATDMDRALAVDPLSPLVRIGELIFSYVSGDRTGALRAARTNIELFPSIWVNIAFGSLGLNGEGYADEALTAIHRASAIEPDNPFLLGTLALIHGEQHREDEARVLIERMEQIAATRYVSAYAFALAYSGGTDVDKVFDYLAESIDENDPWPFVLFGATPLTRMWSSAEFVKHPKRVGLLKKLNLSPMPPSMLNS